MSASQSRWEFLPVRRETQNEQRPNLFFEQETIDVLENRLIASVPLMIALKHDTLSPTNKAIMLAPPIFARTTERTLKRRQQVFVSDEESHNSDRTL